MAAFVFVGTGDVPRAASEWYARRIQATLIGDRRLKLTMSS
jgi:hypothetical protein